MPLLGQLLERVLLLGGERSQALLPVDGHGARYRRPRPSQRISRRPLRCPMPTWDDVVEIGRASRASRSRTSFGTPAPARCGQGMICRLRTDPDALVLRVTDLGEREALLQGQPEAFFSTPHYDGCPYVLVRLDEVDPSSSPS